jgi:hypothetical protein
MNMKTATKNKKLTRFDFIFQVNELLQKYQVTTAAILDDYRALAMPVEDDLILELGAAEDVLVAAIEALDVEPAKEMLLQSLNEAYCSNDIDSDEILKLIDKSDIRDYAMGEFDITIICTDGNQRIKLEEFIKTEIYPYYLDQQAYTNL